MILLEKHKKKILEQSGLDFTFQFKKSLRPPPPQVNTNIKWKILQKKRKWNRRGISYRYGRWVPIKF